VQFDGYRSASKPKASPSNRILVPRPHSSSQLLVKPSISLFDPEQDQRYFGLFSEQVATDISSYFDSSAWTDMILQACASECSVPHAAVDLVLLGRL
jgi:hypothetical protein